MSTAPVRIPDRDNAAMSYGQVYQSWQAFRRRREKEPDEIEHESSEAALETMCRRFLESQKGIPELLREASEKSGCWFRGG